MWLIAEYKPVTLFSLKSGTATSSGAKTLFLPTPFAIRTAILDATIRTRGFAEGKLAFNWIREIAIALNPPRRLVITNLFTKILKPIKNDSAKSSMDRTIAFREYVHFEGTLLLALEVTEEYLDILNFLLTQINYFGKRGSFFQLVSLPEKKESLSENFILLNGPYIKDGTMNNEWPKSFRVGIIQVMDDWGEDLTFEKINIYSDDKIELGKDRIRKNVILPYRLVRASRSFSYYECV